MPLHPRFGFKIVVWLCLKHSWVKTFLHFKLKSAKKIHQNRRTHLHIGHVNCLGNSLSHEICWMFFEKIVQCEIQFSLDWIFWPYLMLISFVDSVRKYLTMWINLTLLRHFVLAFTVIDRCMFIFLIEFFHKTYPIRGIKQSKFTKNSETWHWIEPGTLTITLSMFSEAKLNSFHVWTILSNSSNWMKISSFKKTSMVSCYHQTYPLCIVDSLCQNLIGHLPSIGVVHWIQCKLLSWGH